MYLRNQPLIEANKSKHNALSHTEMEEIEKSIKERNMDDERDDILNEEDLEGFNLFGEKETKEEMVKSKESEKTSSAVQNFI